MLKRSVMEVLLEQILSFCTCIQSIPMALPQLLWNMHDLYYNAVHLLYSTIVLTRSTYFILVLWCFMFESSIYNIIHSWMVPWLALDSSGSRFVHRPRCSMRSWSRPSRKALASSSTLAAWVVMDPFDSGSNVFFVGQVSWLKAVCFFRHWWRPKITYHILQVWGFTQFGAQIQHHRSKELSKQRKLAVSDRKQLQTVTIRLWNGFV